MKRMGLPLVRQPHSCRTDAEMLQQCVFCPAYKSFLEFPDPDCIPACKDNAWNDHAKSDPKTSPFMHHYSHFCLSGTGHKASKCPVLADEIHLVS